MAAHISCVCGKVGVHLFILIHFHSWPPPGTDLLSKSRASDAPGVWLLWLSSGFLSAMRHLYLCLDLSESFGAGTPVGGGGGRTQVSSPLRPLVLCQPLHLSQGVHTELYWPWKWYSRARSWPSGTSWESLAALSAVWQTAANPHSSFSTQHTGGGLGNGETTRSCTKVPSTMGARDSQRKSQIESQRKSQRKNQRKSQRHSERARKVDGTAQGKGSDGDGWWLQTDPPWYQHGAGKLANKTVLTIWT